MSELTDQLINVCVSYPFFVIERGDGDGVFVRASRAAAVEPQCALRL